MRYISINNLRLGKTEEQNMENKSFDYRRIAEGYANDRPFLHGQVIDLIKRDLHISGNFENGLDIGCGAGLSTKALKMLCDKVTGVDISDEMIGAAKALYRDDAYTFLQSSAEKIKAPADSFDIATAAGVVNWVDEKEFLKNLRPLMREKGLLFVYDFWITDKMKGNDAYGEWWHKRYLKEFPRPPRKENEWTREMTLPYGFYLNKQAAYTLEYDFDKDSFIRFMMIQSNVNAQIEEGGRNVREVREWFEDSLKDIFTQRKETLVFEGYYWNYVLAERAV